MHMDVCNYDVFLCFRGPDVRECFLQCFREQLKDAGIVRFLDSEEIKDGECINDKIVEAIKRSYICVPVFSEDFATSPACLMEVAQMVESGKTILPIFYGVEPCDVRHQLGTYEKSFTEHVTKKRYSDSIEKWKAALRQIAGNRGPVFQNDSTGYHVRLRVFVGNLSTRLKLIEREDNEDLVGTDEHVPDMMRKLGFKYQDGQVVEQEEMTGRWVLTVWGMPGVGKTTLARVVYDKISHLFEGCSFLENVKEEIEGKGLVSLQNRLIYELKRGGKRLEVESSNQGTRMIRRRFKISKVLIVLDDVDDYYEQIKPLAELNWFGLRSRIILTTRKQNVYKVQGRNDEDTLYDPEHEIGIMEKGYALELFQRRAFGNKHPRKDHDEMSWDIISAVGYLPLAIDFVGYDLRNESKDKWRRKLDALNGKLTSKVEEVLEAFYQGLSHEAKEVFLDIACFFTGIEETLPCYLWAARRQDSGVDELQAKSFLKIGKKKKFSMHSQLKFLGRGIVEKENHQNPSGRSRLWDDNDVRTIWGKNEKASKVQALRVSSYQVDGKEFYYLPNLRFLELDNVIIKGNPENFPPSLQWLDWRGCHDKAKLFAFNMEKLIILNLCSSSVKLSLKEWEQLMAKAGSLEVLNLKGCDWIHASMEFPASEHLKCLILEGCLYIKTTIHDSISRFGKLVSLNMKHCKEIKDLPQALCSMNELKELLIDGTKIEILDFKDDSLPALEILSARKCKRLNKITDSIGSLGNLRKLILRKCEALEELPPVMGKLVLLEEMDLSKTLICELPRGVKNCKELQVLKMARTYLEEFPEAIKDLKELRELDFNLCGCLRGCCDITGLSSLRILRLKRTKISKLLSRDNVQSCLHILELDNGVVQQTIQMQSSVSKHKRKRRP